MYIYTHHLNSISTVNMLSCENTAVKRQTFHYRSRVQSVQLPHGFYTARQHCYANNWYFLSFLVYDLCVKFSPFLMRLCCTEARAMPPLAQGHTVIFHLFHSSPSPPFLTHLLPKFLYPLPLFLPRSHTQLTPIPLFLPRSHTQLTPIPLSLPRSHTQLTPPSLPP